MHWNCPHCGINLAVKETQLGTGWAFSRCYKCGGFALIRRAEINVIKVDKAPPGERVILPEGSEDSSIAALNKEAMQKMVKHHTKTTQIEAKASRAPATPLLETNSPVSAYPSAEKGKIIDFNQAPIPDPLPEIPEASTGFFKFLPLGISLAATMAVISGIFLFIYGNSIWKKSQEVARNTDTTRFDENTQVSFAKPAQAIGTQIAAATPRLANTLPAPPEQKPMITDRVQQSAMAPIKIAAGTAVKSDLPTRVSSLKIKTVSSIVNIHSGPGLNFPVIAKTNSKSVYIVSEWNGRWIKLSNPIGWIQNDLVKVITE